MRQVSLRHVLGRTAISLLDYALLVVFTLLTAMVMIAGKLGLMAGSPLALSTVRSLIFSLTCAGE